MRRIHIAILVITLVLLGVGLRYFAFWSAKGALESVTRNNLEPLASVVEASIGGTLARSNSQNASGPENGAAGAFAAYSRNPEAIRRDKAYFATWFNALRISGAALENGHTVSPWQSSVDVPWIPVSQRSDAWGHAFCVASDNQYSFVVSAGPQALTSLSCNELHVSIDVFKQMPFGRLNEYAGGALVFVAAKGNQHRATG
jgi:hypothetical protein